MRGRQGIAAAFAALLLAGCAGSAETVPTPADPSPSGSASAAAIDACARQNLTTITSTSLVIATTTPALEPWFADDDPENGEGYASALAYALAEELGFTRLEVQWALERGSVLPLLAPQEPSADLAIADMPIQESVASPVASSDPYYVLNQALVVRAGSALEDVRDMAGLRGARLAAVGDDAAAFAAEVLAPRTPVPTMTVGAAAALVRTGALDGMIVDLPTVQAVLVARPDLAMAGQFEPGPDALAYGVALAQGNPLVACVNAALADLGEHGELTGLRDAWLAAPNPRVIAG